MKRVFGALIYLFLTIWCLGPARACDYCIASHGISPVELGATGIRYDLRYLHLGDIFENGKLVSNPWGIQETYVTHQLSINYRPSDVLTFSLLLPFSSRSALVAGTASDVQGTTSGQQPQHHVDDHPETRADYASGVADIIALAKYRLLDENSSADDPLTLVLTGGLKLPTGKTNVKASDGELLDEHMQLGSGSTDIIGGFSILKGFDDWTLVGSFLGILPTEGANGYTYGANLNYDLGIRYRILDGESVGGSLFGSLSMMGELRGKERKDGVLLDNSGGNTTYIAPGAVYFVTSRISVEASYQYPFLHDLNGTQLGESYRIACGAQYLF